MGRPSKFTAEILETICQGLEQGIPLTVICREGQEADPDFPAPRTVMDWQANDDDISAAIVRAREAGEFAIAEQCLEIAEDERHDWVMSKKGEITDEVALGRAKLRIETRLKLLAKFNPKRWGDKVEVDNKHSGNVGMTILTAVPEPAPAGDEPGA